MSLKPITLVKANHVKSERIRQRSAFLLVEPLDEPRLEHCPVRPEGIPVGGRAKEAEDKEDRVGA